MMKDLSNKDLERISAYLDGELSQKAASDLESRLKTDKSLSQVLEGLRKTRLLLHQAPKAKVPRNFTLTPEMISRRSSLGRLFGTMRLVSAMAMVMFVAVVVGDVLTDGGKQLGLLSSINAADTAEIGAAESMQMAAEAPEAAMLEEPGGESLDLADTEMDGSGTDTSGDSAGKISGTPTAMGTAPVEEPAAQDAGADAQDEEVASEAEATEVMELFDAAPTQAVDEDDVQDDAINDENERAMVSPVGEAEGGDGENIGVGGGIEVANDQSQPNEILTMAFRVVEIGLVMVAVGGFLVARAVKKA